MKALSLLLLFACFTLPSYSQIRHDITMTVEGVEREFIVARPSGAVPAEGYPVVFMFHGTSGDGERFYNHSGWKEKGEAEKFISVFPSSLEYCIIDSNRQKRTTKWNNGDLQSVACPGQVFKDDLLFVRRMLDTLVETFRIDQSRLYACGFSNGGVFSSKLAIEMSDVFSAIGVAAGTLHPLDLGTGPKRLIPIAYMIGSMDRNISEAGGPVEAPFNDSALTIFSHLIDRYLTAFVLAPINTKFETPLTITWLYNSPPPDSRSSQFSFTLVKDLPHMFPNGTNHPLTAANAFWQFFQQFALTSSVGDEGIAMNGMDIYPNPAREFVRITGGSASHVIVRTLPGEQVLSQDLSDDGIVQLPKMAAGIYFLEIRAGKKCTVRRLVIE